MRASRLLLLVFALSAAAAARQRFDFKVREDLFAGMDGDKEAFDRAMKLIDGKPTPIEPHSLRDCTREGAGYTMGSDEPMHAEALGDALAFLRRTVRPA